MIVIDQEFKALIPPLSNEEFSQLEANIIADGCRDPLVLWGNTIIDGHNRYEICETNGIEYRTHNIELENREAALDWIDANQLGRRNLSPDVMSLIRGRMYNRRKKPRNDGGAGVPKTTEDQNDPRLSTAESMGQQFGVSAPTIKRDGKFAEAVESLKDHVPEIESMVAAAEIPKKTIIEAAKDPIHSAEVIEKTKTAHVSHNSGNNEWYTPEPFIQAARAVMGSIDLDPATSEIANRTVGADIYYTVDDDGLSKEWPVGRIWMNPPYSQPLIGRFAQRIADESRRGSEAIVLVNNATETAWFQVMTDACSSICFPKTRVKFLDPAGKPSGAPLQGQAIIYFGNNPELFIEEFEKFGQVFHRA